MESTARSFLEALLHAPGVSGYEHSVQDVVREYVAAFADEVSTDLHGNVIAVSNPGADVRLMLPGHCDQLGLIVSHIDENGFLYFQTVGGWDPQQLVGQRVSVWTASGPINGVVARKAIHLLDDNERKQVADLKDLWIDIGAADHDDAASVVQIADSITVTLGLSELRHGKVNAPAMDNRAGVWVVMEALRRASAKGLKCSLYAVSTVAEEIGWRGAQTSAFGIDPHVGVAVDVTHATDCPTVDKRQRGDLSLGGGPVIIGGPNVNIKVRNRLMELADAAEIPYQLAAVGRAAGNDANPLQINRAGVATGVIQIPLRYMHSAVETIAWDDLDQCADLLAAFACDVTDAAVFTP